MSKATLLWLDLEMTGLDAQTDLILEVAVIATGWDFEELGAHEGIVKNDEEALERRFAVNGTFWGAHQHARDGLMKQNAEGKSLQEVEAELMRFIDEHFDADKPVYLAGNSIHMDRRFVTAHWPLLETRLHYRMLDVSAWKVVFEGKYGKKFAKPEAHRALGDIRGSIEEMKYYLGKVTL